MQKINLKKILRFLDQNQQILFIVIIGVCVLI